MSRLGRLLRSKERTNPNLIVAVIFFASLTVVAISFIANRLTRLPNYQQESDLQDQLSSADLGVYNALLSLDLASKGGAIMIQSDENKIFESRKKAQQIWDSIPVGTPIYKRGVGREGPVGKNLEVEDLRKNADWLEQSVKKKKQEVARIEGHKLLNTSLSSAWQARQSIIEKLENLHAKHSWYYGSPLGTFLSIINVLSRLLFIVSGFFSVLLVIPAIASLIRKQ